MGGGMHWRTVRIENMKPTKVKVSKSYLHSHHTHEYHNSWQWPSQGVFYLINSVLAIIMNVWIKSFKSHPCWKDITAVIIWNYLALRTELLIFIFNDVLVLISHFPFNDISSHQIWRLLQWWLFQVWFLHHSWKVYIYFLHAKPWIPGGEKSIFMVVIH